MCCAHKQTGDDRFCHLFPICSGNKGDIFVHVHFLNSQWVTGCMQTHLHSSLNVTGYYVAILAIFVVSDPLSVENHLRMI